jgi:hypothetical protein
MLYTLMVFMIGVFVGQEAVSLPRLKNILYTMQPKPQKTTLEEFLDKIKKRN